MHWGDMAPNFKEPIGHKTTTKKRLGAQKEGREEGVVIQRGKVTEVSGAFLQQMGHKQGEICRLGMGCTSA